MKLKQTENLKLLGKDQILPHLQTNISKATGSILIVGPWLDAYFIGKVIDSLPNLNIEVRFMVRIDGDDVIDTKTLSALNLARKNIKNFQARTLKNLHSKVILIDNEIFYLGSANWYWYSLHESLEVTVTGNTNILPELVRELYDYWDKGTPLNRDDLKDYLDLEPVKTCSLLHTTES
jgi:phosphatidylserine/phosphatidylglycerophosphate/cardiolipin synthase-like enzyme